MDLQSRSCYGCCANFVREPIWKAQRSQTKSYLEDLNS